MVKRRKGEESEMIQVKRRLNEKSRGEQESKEKKRWRVDRIGQVVRGKVKALHVRVRTRTL